MNSLSLYSDESIVYALRSLYGRYGYSHYKMNKFEEYDLYARNKDFLFSDGVITFTDTNGKLMALKPDVTLSIVKNTRDRQNGVQKLCYNENVYRVSKGTHSFKETMQVGLEAIGDIDDYAIYEVISLAAESLVLTGKNCILEISHLGILSDVLDYIGVPEGETDSVLQLIAQKNVHELLAKCSELGIPDDKSALLRELISIYGTADEVLDKIISTYSGIIKEENLSQFVKIINALSSDKNKALYRIDFSLAGNIRYYNGFVFRGFAENLPNSVLSGGQYDALMSRMKRRSHAIGFAVYLDMLEYMGRTASKYDVDTLLVYDENCSIERVSRAVEKLEAAGESVLVLKQIPQGIKYRHLEKLGKDGEADA